LQTINNAARRLVDVSHGALRSTILPALVRSKQEKRQSSRLAHKGFLVEQFPELRLKGGGMIDVAITIDVDPSESCSGNGMHHLLDGLARNG
jgi:hypothetical protein